MVKHIIGATIVAGVAGIAFAVGAAFATVICTAGVANIYQLEGGGRVIAWFPCKAKIPDAWGEEAKRACLSYYIIE